MSKFTVKVELQGYEVKLQGLKFSVEGTKEDAPKIAQQIEKQLSGMIQAPAILASPGLTSGNGSPVIEGEVLNDDGTGKKKRIRKSSAGGTKTPADEINFVHDSSQYGSPLQGWTQVQKAIWFLYVVGKQTQITQLTGYSIAKNFNRLFKAAGQINNGNVTKGLDGQKLKGTNATVGSDMTDGTAKYFLTTTGIALAESLAKGEAVNAD
jgi:hypothetical protein